MLTSAVVLNCFRLQSPFRRAQLKALVSLHSREENFGGNLRHDEVAIIRGALELNSKTAAAVMTPLSNVSLRLTPSNSSFCYRLSTLHPLALHSKQFAMTSRPELAKSALQVFMLSADAVLDEAQLWRILQSGHSRIPVHRADGGRSVSPCPRTAAILLHALRDWQFESHATDVALQMCLQMTFPLDAGMKLWGFCLSKI